MKGWRDGCRDLEELLSRLEDQGWCLACGVYGHTVAVCPFQEEEEEPAQMRKGSAYFASLAHQHTQRLRCWLRGSTIVRPPQRISMTTVWIELSRVHLWGLQVGTFHPQCFVD
ncbi:UNVERIFIED_CONTAM: hypothetical protein FKN15_043808 [Acipenser sinensis]